MAYDFCNIQKCINHCLEPTQRLNVHGPLEPGISNTYHQLGEEIADSWRTESPGQNKQLWSCGLHAMLFHCASCWQRPCSISIPHLGIKLVSPSFIIGLLPPSRGPEHGLSVNDKNHPNSLFCAEIPLVEIERLRGLYISSEHGIYFSFTLLLLLWAVYAYDHPGN